MLSQKIHMASKLLMECENAETMKNPLLLFSGGKDSIVAAHLARKVLGVRKAFCEASLLPRKTRNEILDIAKYMDIEIHFSYEPTPETFAKHWFEQVPPKPWKPSTTDKIRHWRSMPKYAKANNVSMMIFGRRTEENTIPNPAYKTAKYNHVLQVHPLWNWTRQEIFEYKEYHGLRFPSCYQDGSKHLYNVISLMQHEYKKSGDINRCFDIMATDHIDYLIEGAKVDQRAANYLGK